MKEKIKVALCLCPSWAIETPPLGLGILSAIAKNNNCEFKQFDMNLSSARFIRERDQQKQENLWSVDQTYKWLNNEHFESELLPIFDDHWTEKIDEIATYDIVSFTVLFSNLILTDYIAQKIIKKNPSIHIFYGGPMIWEIGYKRETFSSKTIEYKEWIKLACPIEGEEVFHEAINCFRDRKEYSTIPGIWAKVEGSTFQYTGKRPGIKKLDTIPTANWDGVDLQSYAPFHYRGVTHLPLQGSRGCTFKCTFCSETRLYRYKTGERIKDEIIEHYKKYGIKDFLFVDSLINGSMPQFKKLIHGLEEKVESKELPKLFMGGYARVHDDMDNELISKASKVGLNLLSIGIESGSPKILELIEKGQTVEQAEKVLKECFKNDILAISNWITGYPKENHMDWIISLSFLFRNRKYLQNISASSFAAGVTHGTPLDVHRDFFNISKNYYILYDWVSNDFRNTYINRRFRLKLAHFFIELFKFSCSGTGDIRSAAKHFKVLNENSFFNSELFKNWDSKVQGSFTANKHNIKTVEELNEIKNINFNVPYLEFCNIEENPEYDFKESITEIIKKSVRNEIKVLVWLLHQTIGPLELEFEWAENYADRNIPGIALHSKFSFYSQNDGSYNLEINNNLEFSTSALESQCNKLPIFDNNGTVIREEFIDIQFKDSYTDSGNFNNRYINENYIQEKYNCVPNHVDSFDREKYHINLKRTPLTIQF